MTSKPAAVVRATIETESDVSADRLDPGVLVFAEFPAGGRATHRFADMRQQRLHVLARLCQLESGLRDLVPVQLDARVRQRDPQPRVEALAIGIAGLVAPPQRHEEAAGVAIDVRKIAQPARIAGSAAVIFSRIAIAFQA